MLVLTRKKNQSIMVGDEVEIVVVDTHGDQVKIGINAPRAVSIYRKEIYEQIQKENIEAAATKTDLSKLGEFFKKKPDTSPEGLKKDGKEE